MANADNGSRGRSINHETRGNFSHTILFIPTISYCPHYCKWVGGWGKSASNVTLDFRWSAAPLYLSAALLSINAPSIKGNHGTTLSSTVDPYHYQCNAMVISSQKQMNKIIPRFIFCGLSRAKPWMCVIFWGQSNRNGVNHGNRI